MGEDGRGPGPGRVLVEGEGLRAFILSFFFSIVHGSRFGDLGEIWFTLPLYLYTCSREIVAGRRAMTEGTIGSSMTSPSSGWSAAMARLLSPIFRGQLSLQFLWVVAFTQCYIPFVYMTISFLGRIFTLSQEERNDLFEQEVSHQRIYESFIDDRKANGNKNFFEQR